MRGIVIGLGIVAGLVGVPISAAHADDESKRLIGGVVSGLLGEPPPAADALYSAKERERLASYLQSGEYATSRQGEPVDLMVFGVPLTHRDHVYAARPIPPSATADRLGR